VNARGTLNLLEALRALPKPPPILFTSTNKVYGDLNTVPLRADQSRYEPEDERIRTRGFDETNKLDFHSPYGCSKGAAEQYVLDYARTFGLRAVVFRMSCIYGPHQFGTEDQGWVAHFLIRALKGKPVSIYGDGKQVRDILFIDDLVRAMCLAHEQIDAVSGHAFNIGGGANHTISLLELLDLISDLQGRDPEVYFNQWRPADQRYYVSDTSRFSNLTGWAPQVTVREGVARLYEWLQGRERKQPATVVLPAPAALRAAADGFPIAIAMTRLSSTPPSGKKARRQRLWKSKPPEAAEEGTILQLPRVALKS